MATITIRKEYADGDILFGSDLDAIIQDIETFLNTTRINDDNIQNAGITASDKLVDATVVAAKLASNAVTTTKILDANVTLAKMAAASVGTSNLVDSSVTLAKMADASVGTTELVDSSVTLAKMADASVGTTELVDLAVTTGKLADSAVTAAKITDGTVTRSKLTGGFALNTASGAGNNTVQVSAGSYTFSGRPTMFVIYTGNLTEGTSGATISLTDGTTTFFSYTFPQGHPINYTANPVVRFIASPPAGASSMYFIRTGGSGNFTLTVGLAIIEL